MRKRRKRSKSFGELLEESFRRAGCIVLKPGEPLPPGLDGARPKKKRKVTKPTARKALKKARPAR